MIRVGHRLLPLDGVVAAEMQETSPQLLRDDPNAVRRRLELDGYVYFRSVLPREAVTVAGEAVAGALATAGWLEAGSDPRERRVRPDFREHTMAFNGYSIVGPGVASPTVIPDPKMGSSVVGAFHGLQNDPRLRAVLHSHELFWLASGVLGEEVGCLNYRWMRAVLPEQLAGHGYHMDNVYMGRGSKRLHTFWIPLQDIGCEAEGGLVVLEGSNQRPEFRRVRETFGEQEQFGSFGQDPAEVAAVDPQARWVTAKRYRAGDVVVFGMKTMHGGVTNSTDTVRLSVDTRFQPLRDAHDPRFPMHGYGDTPPFRAEDFIAQQASMADHIGPTRDTPAFASWEEVSRRKRARVCVCCCCGCCCEALRNCLW